MNLKKCEKCNNELPFSAKENEVKCAFCGEVYHFKNVKVKRGLTGAKRDSSDLTTILAATFIAGSGGE